MNGGICCCCRRQTTETTVLMEWVVQIAMEASSLMSPSLILATPRLKLWKLLLHWLKVLFSFPAAFSLHPMTVVGGRSSDPTLYRVGSFVINECEWLFCYCIQSLSLSVYGWKKLCLFFFLNTNNKARKSLTCFHCGTCLLLTTPAVSASI